MIHRLHRTGFVIWFAVTLSCSAQEPAAWQAKMDPRLWAAAETSNAPPADVLIVLKEQADLGGAASLRGKRAKGRYVFEQLRAAARRSQGPVLDVLAKEGRPARSFWIVNMIQAELDAGALRRTALAPGIARIVPNPRVAPDLPAPEQSPQLAPLAAEWNVAKVRAPELWTNGIDGSGVVVAGQDTGYAWAHPALKHAYRGWDGTNADHNFNWHDAIHSGGGVCGHDTKAPCDDQQHGTHTMGTMVGDDGLGNQIGVAPGARWIGCRNMDQGNGTPATYSECFQWFLAPTDTNDLNPDPDRAPDVINNSWSCPPSEGCTDPLVLKTVVENVRAAGIFVVVSAGNYGSACSSVQDPPAIYEAVLSVGNVTSADAISSSSSRGPVTIDGSGRMKPNVSAPGSNIRSSIPASGYGSMNGTSMAGPHVAGLVALILDAHPGLRGEIDRIENLIERTCVPLTNAEQTCGGISGTNVPNNTFGWGRIDAVEAVGLHDSDGDGMPNWWEVVFARDRTNAADAHVDADGDGMTTYQEYVANTDPTNGASVLRVTDLVVSPTGSVHIAWNGAQDGFDTPRSYAIYRAPSQAGAWELLADGLEGSGATSAWGGASADGTGLWFYCVAAVQETNEVRSPALAAHAGSLP